MLILECSQGCYVVKFWPGYLDLWPMRLWPWKSIGFQIILRTKYVPSFIKHPLKNVDSRVFTRMFEPVTLIFNIWPWKTIGFQILLRTKYVPSLVKIHWRMLILECSQGCYAVKIWPDDLDLWPWKSIGFQILLRTKYVTSLVKIHWRILILECSQGCDGRTVALLYPFATSLARG